jgi:perosamine synthetase
MPRSTQSPIDPDLIDEEIQEVLAELAGTAAWSLYHGQHSERLIEELSNRFERRYVQLCCSGTIAVELALRSCRIGPDDEVLLAGYDFPGNFRAIEAVGAQVAIADIEPQTWCMAPKAELDEQVRPGTKAVIVSHLHGTLVPMAAWQAWCQRHGIFLIEDACQVPGAVVDGRPAGSWGDVSVLSFGGSKLLSAGRGGAILTNNERMDQRIRILRVQGNDPFPMSELQAAVLIPQLSKLDARRNRHAAIIAKLESSLQGKSWLRLPQRTSPVTDIAFYKWGFEVVSSHASIEDVRKLRDQTVAKLQAEEIHCGPGFNGFTQRSSQRCRRVDELPFAKQASVATVLVHHTMLHERLLDVICQLQ